MRSIEQHLVTLLSVLSVVHAAMDELTLCPRNLPSTSRMVEQRGLCYQFVNTEKYWPGARDYCLQHGGRLIKIGNPGVNSFIRKTLSELWWNNNGIWIGLHDQNREQVWEWTGYSREDQEPASWTYWGAGHPGPFFHSRKDCVIMERNRGLWTWTETYCDSTGYTYRFICQYRAIYPSTVSTTVELTTTEATTTHHLDEHHTTTTTAGYTTAGYTTAGYTTAGYTTAEELITSDEGIHLAPRLAEMKSELEQVETSNVGLWLIMAGCSSFCIFIIATVCVVVRYRRVKKQQEHNFESLDRNPILGQSVMPGSQTPGYMNRPACPLPAAPEFETCAPNPYCPLSYDEFRPPRAESNLYLNSDSVTYCPMNQSTSSIDKLPPAPANPCSTVMYATPARSQNSSYLASRPDEYLCPSEVTGSDVMSRYELMGEDEKKIEETYDKPKASNEYSEIPEVFYNNVQNVYEAL